uniref:Uncharacterized protein n=1 Tax=Schistocephalus solidus TaxID=70667 RepID=A0A0X3Q3L7_SCHSO
MKKRIQKRTPLVRSMASRSFSLASRISSDEPTICSPIRSAFSACSTRLSVIMDCNLPISEREVPNCCTSDCSDTKRRYISAFSVSRACNSLVLRSLTSTASTGLTLGSVESQFCPRCRRVEEEDVSEPNPECFVTAPESRPVSSTLLQYVAT